MLHLTQILSFEIGQDCTLENAHKGTCPINHINRAGQTLTDEIIISSVVSAYANLGFEGLISWSFYNEPMLHADRMLKLMAEIRQILPRSRFLLWTNGTILKQDPRMDLFEQIYVTNYLNKSVEDLIKNFGYRVQYKFDPKLDDRINHYTKPNKERCLLPFDNFLISNNGDAYICCMDWMNEIKIGNLFETSLKNLDERRWEIVKTICGKEMSDNAPKACKGCAFKWGTAVFDSKIREKALEEIGQL